MIRKLLNNRNLLKNLVLRDLKNRYVGSMGGFLWSVIHPLVLLISYTFVFSVVLKLKPGPEYGTDSFPIFLFCGMLPWLLFTDTVVRNCTSITDNAHLVTKTVIPAEILPISITISNVVHHLIGLAMLLIILGIFHEVHLSAFGILIYLPMLLMLAQGLGWIVAGLHVFLRDTIQAVQILIFLWFCLTPIFYAPAMIPSEFQLVVRLNPLAVLVDGYRNSLLNSGRPSAADIAPVLATSVAVFVIGGLLFKRAKPAFPDVL